MPRAFVDGIPNPAPESIDLPAPELKKFRNVLRLRTGAQVAILPGDGRVLRCRMNGIVADVIETVWPETDSKIDLTLALALSRPDTLETSVRMATEMGASRFVLFPSARSVVRWDESKLKAKLVRLENIAREASEVCFRTVLPEVFVFPDLVTLLHTFREALVLSEGESVSRPLVGGTPQITLVIGPEGGWAPQEVAIIESRAVSLGPRVLRVDTAVAAACALALFSPKVS